MVNLHYYIVSELRVPTESKLDLILGERVHARYYGMCLGQMKRFQIYRRIMSRLDDLFNPAVGKMFK